MKNHRMKVFQQSYKFKKFNKTIKTPNSIITFKAFKNKGQQIKLDIEMSFKYISNLSTMENIQTKQMLKRPFISNPSLLFGAQFYGDKRNSSNEFTTTVLKGRKGNINSSFQPSSNNFYSQNAEFNEIFEIQMNELDLLKQKIEGKALNEQKYIDEIYKQLRDLEKFFTNDLRQVNQQSSQSQKNQTRSIITKIKSLFAQLKKKSASNIANNPYPLVKMLEQEIEYKLPAAFQEEEKARQKEWSNQIDALSQQTINLEKEIQELKSESNQSFRLFEQNVAAMQSLFENMIYEEKKMTEYEHDFILRLINKSAQQIVHL